MSMNPATSSGVKTAAAQITVLSSNLRGVILIGGADASSVTVYDNALGAASGVVLAKIKVAANTSQELILNEGVVANNGLYCTITGTTPEYIVLYELSA